MTNEKKIGLDKAYHDFYQIGIIDQHASLDILDKIVSADFMGYGTARDEEVHSIDQLKQMIIRQRRQSVGIDMQFSIVPVLRKFTSEETTAVYVDDITIVLNTGDTPFELAVRFTAVFEYAATQWKVVHMHASVPGQNEGETDTWGIDEWKRRNAELEKQVVEKTADLKIKNRELEIEAALERVRSVANAMQSSDDLLDVITIVGQQLEKLGLQFDSTNFRINVGEKDWDLWIYAKWLDAPRQWYVPYIDHPYFTTKEVAGEVSTMVFSKQDRDSFNQYLTELKLIEIPDDATMAASQKEYFDSGKGFAWSIATGKKVSLNIANSQAKPYTEEENALLMRFTIAFEQAYTRFLDLQKAEAQAKEAQIEAALEKIRSRSLAMHRSDELKEVIIEVLRKLEELGVAMENKSAIICLYQEGSKEFEQWVASPEHSSAHMVRATFFDSKIHNDIWDARNNGTDFYAKSYTVEEKNAMFQFFFDHPDLGSIPENEKNWLRERQYYELACAFEKHSAVMIANFTAELLDSGVHEILKRFGKVFEQAYIRFLDLQKAEAQAKEAQIEAALEKVRSRSLAMRKSEELKEVVATVFEKMNELHFLTDGGVSIVTEFKQFEYAAHWVKADSVGAPVLVKFPHNQNAVPTDFMLAKSNGTPFYSKRYTKEVNENFWKLNFEYGSYAGYPDDFKNTLLNTEVCHFAAAFEKNSAITVSTFTDQALTEEQITILQRFAKVFEQSYIRFLDLQKAETQAREAQIELGLERVRARAMAMHNSEELNELIGTVFNELTKLDFSLTRCVIMIYDPISFDVRWWMANSEAPSKPMNYLVKHHPMLLPQEYVKAWHARELKWQYQLAGEIKKEWDEFLFSKTELSLLPDFVIAGMKAPESVWLSSSFNNFGSLTLASLEPLSDEHFDIMLRFAKVFDLTYTRFNDLQKAEKQTKEAQIEAALERVRSRTMAMQTSVELTETVTLLFEEFKKFQTEPDMANLSRGFITTIHQEKQCFDLWITDVKGNEIKQYFKIDFAESTTGMHIYQGWKNKQPNVIVDLSGEQLNQWLDYLTNLGFPVGPGIYGTRRVNNFIYHSNGFIGITSSFPLTEKSLRLLERFAKVFDLTYTRFADLQQAEARALLAVREASLDRVRAEIASMRTAEDLQRITPLVWRELTTLHVPFFRCGLFIVDEEKEHIHFYLSSVDGSPLAAIELPINGNTTTQNATAHWRQQKIYTSHWSKEEFIQFAGSLVSQGQVHDVSTYQGGIEAPDSLTLQFVPFTQGMMYVGSAEELSAEQLNLVQSLADAFSTAYARYEDFIRLESAKQQIEHTLKDLRATQTQLIQSEKMASLGELTAGIAHEIQNPLNFVNNFSEVSAELVEEMYEELAKGNTEDAKEIATDLKSNLEKINHHGRRAGDIVKGMLQHSRSSSGVKEPTDINALTDEYLRLAYHGLRAKDKSFNATLITDFDDSIGMIDMIPQDIGRVILNLITNAFYVVDEKKKQIGEGYEPTVSVSTKKTDGKIEVSVKDNGNGISQKILDKIFQPFFTTKPTGQGTGLGLSLSYDIVKAHGGEIKVHTKENEGMRGEQSGTEFTIQLPI